MLNGFVINEDDLAQAPLRVAKVKTNLFKRYYVSVIASVLVHLLLAFLLFSIAEKQQIKQEKITTTAIKSYLYTMPAKQVEIKATKVVARIKDQTVEFKQTVSTEAVIKKEKSHSKVKLEKATTSSTATAQVKAKSNKNNSPQASFSAYKQLENLRKSINEKMIAQELLELQQFRSPSVMHGNRIPVPHSNIPLTSEQARERKVTKMSNDISITKYDNGICVIEREQFLGSPVEGSSAAFTCGESKYDKSFREHMKKVQEKLISVNNK